MFTQVLTSVPKAGKYAVRSQSSFLSNSWFRAALQGDEAAAADAVQLRQQLAEAQAQLQAATTQAATLQRQLDSERTAAAGVRRQMEAGEAERTATRKAAARQCAAAEAAQQRAEADARAARAELAAGIAEVRLAEQGTELSRQVLKYSEHNMCSAEFPREVSAALCQHVPEPCHGKLCWQFCDVETCSCGCVCLTWLMHTRLSRCKFCLRADGGEGSRHLEGGAGLPEHRDAAAAGAGLGRQLKRLPRSSDSQVRLGMEGQAALCPVHFALLSGEDAF